VPITLCANKDQFPSAVGTIYSDDSGTALRQLDTNGDGVVKQDELCPAGAANPHATHAPTPPGPGPGRGAGPGYGPACDPWMAALDEDQDGQLSAAEIDNPATALKGLDANGDGTLTPDVLRMARPEKSGRG